MPRDAYASLRLPADLKTQVQEIASAEQRSLSKAIELLLWRGVNEFKKDGVLVEAWAAKKKTARKGKPAAREEEQFAELIADRIVAKVLEKLEAGEGKHGDDEHHAAA